MIKRHIVYILWLYFWNRYVYRLTVIVSATLKLPKEEELYEIIFCGNQVLSIKLNLFRTQNIALNGIFRCENIPM